MGEFEGVSLAKNDRFLDGRPVSNAHAFYGTSLAAPKTHLSGRPDTRRSRFPKKRADKGTIFGSEVKSRCYFRSRARKTRFSPLFFGVSSGRLSIRRH